MFKKKFRLPLGNFKSGRSFSSPLFVLKIAKNKEQGPRFGIIVSKKVNKKAVVRNRLKRALRIAIENTFKEKDNIDFLFIVKREPKRTGELQEETKNIHEKING